MVETPKNEISWRELSVLLGKEFPKRTSTSFLTAASPKNSLTENRVVGFCGSPMVHPMLTGKKLSASKSRGTPVRSPLVPGKIVVHKKSLSASKVSLRYTHSSPYTSQPPSPSVILPIPSAPSTTPRRRSSLRSPKLLLSSGRRERLKQSREVEKMLDGLFDSAMFHDGDEEQNARINKPEAFLPKSRESSPCHRDNVPKSPKRTPPRYPLLSKKLTFTSPARKIPYL